MLSTNELTELLLLTRDNNKMLQDIWNSLKQGDQMMILKILL